MEEQVFGVEAWSLPSVLAELSAGDRFSVVAVADDELVGYAITKRSDDVVDLQRIAVLPGCRRRGTARALLTATLERARSDGGLRMLLEVSSENATALGFYAEVGFVEIDRRRRYYCDGSDALVLRLPLGAGRGGRG